MADLPPPNDPTPPAMPRWVKVSGLVAVVVIVSAVLIMVLSGGEHGPGRHLPGGGGEDHTPPVEHSP